MKRFSKNSHLKVRMNWFRAVFMLGVSIILIACGQVKHEPKAGEYGEFDPVNFE